MPLATLTPPVMYFSAIGMGFMLIEISQMQRLMVFLGHPVYGLSVVLFTILLFGGLGSTTVGAHAPRPGTVIARIVALLTTLVVAGLLTPVLTSWARTEATDMRILLSVLLLAPPAFCMGMMFPLGLSIWRRHSELLPFFWSANGITSMFASVLGMALSIEFGIAWTYALGACFYVVCAGMIVASRLAKREVPAAAASSRAVDPVDAGRSYLIAISGLSPKPLMRSLMSTSVFKTGPDRRVRNLLQHIDRNRVAQTVEIVDQLTAGAGQEQPVGPAVFWIRAPLQQPVLDQAVEQADQRDRLQFQHVGQIDLRQSFLLPQSEQYDPLRAGGAAALGAVVDVVAQQARTFHQLRDELTFQVERHVGGGPLGQAFSGPLQSFPNVHVSQVIVCLHIKCTRTISASPGNGFEAPLLIFETPELT